jgi:hypothetical protein
MIRIPTLEQAREEARLLSARGLTVYVYRMSDGGYWLDQLPAARQARIHREGRNGISNGSRSSSS